jgi:phosphohistidine phosphatase
MRHAKAEPFASTDHARVLTDRGHAQAASAGRFLAEQGLLPTHALVSTAARARETWSDVARAAGAEADVAYDEGLYHAGVDGAVETIQLVDPGAETVIFVGHNPTAAYLGHFLDDGEGDQDAISGMLRGFPTGALVVFNVHCAWSEISAESGCVVAFHAP